MGPKPLAILSEDYCSRTTAGIGDIDRNIVNWDAYLEVGTCLRFMKNIPKSPRFMGDKTIPSHGRLPVIPKFCDQEHQSEPNGSTGRRARERVKFQKRTFFFDEASSRSFLVEVFQSNHGLGKDGGQFACSKLNSFSMYYPLVNSHNYRKSPFSMGKFTIHGHFQ